MKSAPYDYIFHVSENSTHYLHLPAFFECLAGLNLSIGVFSDWIEAKHFDVIPISEMERFLGGNNADILVGVDSLEPFRHAQSNCNVLWFLGSEFWKTCQPGLFQFHAPFMDLILCTSHWQQLHVASLLRLNTDQVLCLPPFGHTPDAPETFISERRIVPILHNDSDAVLFDRNLKHLISKRYEQEGMDVQFDPVYNPDDMFKIEGAYLVLIPSQEALSWKPILSHCMAHGIPVIGFGTGDMHYNPKELTAPVGDFEKFADLCFMTDLSREQSSKTLVLLSPTWNSTMKEGMQHFLGATMRAKFRSSHKTRYPQMIKRDVCLDRIWMHMGTGIGDMLIASSAFKNFKAANPNTELCVTVKANDEGGVNRGNVVFDNLLGLCPYIDRVEILHMERGDQGYGVSRDALQKRGIDPNLLLSVDMIPNFLMRNRTESSILDEVFHALNVIPEYHQEICTDEMSYQFGKRESGKDTIILCFEGSPVHEGRTTLSNEVAEELVRRIRSNKDLSGKKLVMIGVGLEERQAWCEKIGDVSFYNKTRIREDIELISNAYCVISVDTGMAHVAMTLRVPLIGIYSEFNFPYWVAPYYRKLPYNKFVVGSGKNLESITPEQIEKALLSFVFDDLSKTPEKIAIVHPGSRESNLFLEPAVRELGKTGEHEITVVSQYPQLWQNNPYIKMAVGMPYGNDPFFHDRYMKDKRVIVTASLPQDQEQLVQDELCKSLGVSSKEYPNIYLAGDDIEWAKMFLEQFDKPIVAVHCFPDHCNKAWELHRPLDYWNELISKMNHKGYTVVALEVPDGAKLEGCVCMPASVYTEFECITVLAASDMMVGIDGFYAHVASVIQKPSVVLWGPTDNRRYLCQDSVNVRYCEPLSCSPCQRPAPFTFDRNYKERVDGDIVSFECSHRTCMRSIRPDVVFSYVRSRMVSLGLSS